MQNRQQAAAAPLDRIATHGQWTRGDKQNTKSKPNPLAPSVNVVYAQKWVQQNHKNPVIPNVCVDFSHVCETTSHHCTAPTPPLSTHYHFDRPSSHRTALYQWHIVQLKPLLLLERRMTAHPNNTFGCITIHLPEVDCWIKWLWDRYISGSLLLSTSFTAVLGVSA